MFQRFVKATLHSLQMTTQLLEDEIYNGVEYEHRNVGTWE
jgi:hypothetical protein